jgi:CheY-like chemotaxis protein
VELPENIDELKNLKVLIINDDYFILQVLTLVMKQEHIEDIDVAFNGFEGYNKAVSKIYDFIVCDLNMPVMDGYQFCANFKKYCDDNNNFFYANQDQTKPKCRPYLIALSALVN